MKSSFHVAADSHTEQACRWLKNVRYLAKVSVAEAGESLGIGHSQLSKLERKHGQPQLVSILACVLFYRVKIVDFFGLFTYSKNRSLEWIVDQLNRTSVNNSLKESLLASWPDFSRVSREEMSAALELCQKYSHLDPSRFIEMKLRNTKHPSLKEE